MAVAPIGLAAWRGRFAPALAAITAASIASLVFVQTGTLQRAGLASTEVTHLLAADPLLGRCEETFQILQENNVVIGRPDEKGLVVNGALWDQLPPELQEAVLACAQQSLGAAAGTNPPPLIRR